MRRFTRTLMTEHLGHPADELQNELAQRGTFRRLVRLVADGRVSASDLSRQVGGLFSEREIADFARLQSLPGTDRQGDPLDYLVAFIRDGRRFTSGPRETVASREQGPRVRATTAAEAVAQIEEDLFKLLPADEQAALRMSHRGKPATIAKAVYKTDAAMRQAVRRTLRSVGLDGMPRAGRRQPLQEPMTGTTQTERERREQRDREARRKRAERAAGRA